MFAPAFPLLTIFHEDKTFMKHSVRYFVPSAFILLMCLFAFGATAQAQTTFFGAGDPRGALTFSSQAEANFKAALPVFGTETVDGLPNNQVSPTLVFGATGITATAGNTFVSSAPSLAISTPKALFNLLNVNQIFTFNQPIVAFGTYLINVGDTPAANTLTFALQNTVLGTSQSFTVGTFGPNASFTNAAYFGVINSNNPFNRVTVQTSASEFYLYDNLTASAVPEPGSVALGACWVLGIGCWSARRRKTL